MKLSIVILCWNDLKVISDCLRSIYSGTHSTKFEVIVSDNGSTDESIRFIRGNYPQVRVIENGENLRFSRGNNVAIRVSTGEYVLISIRIPSSMKVRSTGGWNLPIGIPRPVDSGAEF